MKMEVINLSEVPKTSESQANSLLSRLLAQGRPLSPKRNRRSLIINETIEIELGTDSDEQDSESDALIISDSEQDTDNTIEICKTDISETYPNDLKIDEDEICMDSSDSNGDEKKSKINDSLPVPEENVEIQNTIITKYITSLFRKIAPKEGLDHTTQIDDEKWRINPPKKSVTRKNIKLERSRNIKSLLGKKKKSKAKRVCKIKESKKSSKIIKDVEGSLETLLNAYNINGLSMEVIEEKNTESSLTVDEKEVEETTIVVQNSSDDMQLVECPYCCFKNPKESSMRKHIVSRHSGISDCIYCGFQSFSLKEMKSHLLKHTTDEEHPPKHSLKCPMCKFTSDEVNGLRTHVLAKHRKGIFNKCKLCEFEVETENCKVFTSQMKSLRDHVRTTHSKNEGSVFRCPLCKFRSRIDLEVKSHIHLVHKDLNGSAFRCLQCTVITDSITSLLMHIGVHEKRNIRFSCKRCKFTIFSELWMKLHENTHNKKLFNCPYCYVKKKDHYLLKYHIRERHNLVNFTKDKKGKNCFSRSK